MKVIAIKPLLVSCLLVLWLCAKASAQSYPLWGDLPTGPHAVGFRSFWRADASRPYNMTYDDQSRYAPTQAPRPILINMWYPAKLSAPTNTMVQRDYLNIEATTPRLARFAQKLIQYNKAIIIQELLGKPEKDLNDKERALLADFFTTPTAAHRDAVPQRGPFPLIIYHSGYSSSLEDNAVLCEFLASHGYVVINSVYQKADGSSFNVDGNEGSVSDMRYLIAYARRLSNVDGHKIAIVGHSGGAQAGFIFQARNRSLANVLVSLDTTQDYYSLSDDRWDYMTDTVLKKIKNISTPLLVVARKEAIFQMCDRLKYAERYYLTLENLEHEDFISQGIAQEIIRYKLSIDESTAQDVQERLRAASAVRTDYEIMCRYVLNFLNAYLKNDRKERKLLLTKYRGNHLGATAPNVEYIPRMITAPDKYRTDSPIPPTPRQFRFMLAAQGLEKTTSLLRRFWQQHPKHPIYNIVFPFSLLYELLDKGKVPEALAIYQLYTGLDAKFSAIPRLMTSLGIIRLNGGDSQSAIGWYKKALTLDPDNERAAKKLKEAEAARSQVGN